MEFLQPLQTVEEQEILRRVKNGDKEAKDILVEHNMRLVAYLANKYTIPLLDTEDVISIGTIGLIKAVNTYDKDKNSKFATYASRCIQNEIFMHLRKTKGKQPAVYLNEVLCYDVAGNEMTVLDTLPDEKATVEDKMEKREDVHLICELVDALSMKEKMVIQHRFGINQERKKQEDIAKEYDISQSYVSRLEKRALKKLKRAYDKVIG